MGAKEMSEAEKAADLEKRIEIYARNQRFPFVCICGSMRFYPWMLKVAELETLAGNIVLLPLVRKDADMSDSEKAHQHKVEQALPSGVNLHIMLDAMHRNKIAMSDKIIVCTDAKNYFGDSTRAEIIYACSLGKNIEFREENVQSRLKHG